VSHDRIGRGPDGRGRSRRGPCAQARWLGSSDALAVLGLEPGTEATTDQLAMTLQGRHVQTREPARHAALIEPQAMTAGGRAQPDRGHTVNDRVLAAIHVYFTLPGPEWATETWRQSEPQQRTMIERALLKGAERALAHLVVGQRMVPKRGPQRREAAHGVAAVAAVHVVRQPGKGQAAPVVGLEVRGLLLGVQRADGTLASPSLALTVSKRAKREAERVSRRAIAGDPWLAYSGRQATAAAMAFERGPGTPPRQPVTTGPPSRRIGVPRRDPLEAWRERVGDARAQRIGERADELRDHLAEFDDGKLLALRRKLTAALRPPDRAMARQALSLEHDVARLEVSANEARRNVAGLTAAAATKPKRRRRAVSEAAGAATKAKPRKGALLEAAAVIQDRIADEDSARDRLLRTDDRLPARKRLDTWMNRHTERAAQLVAVDRHLSERLHRQIASEVDHAVLDPPDYVRTAIGSAPAPSAPEHDEWVALTSTLVYDHHVAAASRAAGYEPPRRDPREHRELAARVQSLRARRELEPAGDDTEVADALRSHAASFPSAPGRPATAPATVVPRPRDRVQERNGTVAR